MDLWYKNAVIYSVDVETFMDGDGDGIGDFKGLTNRLDHLEMLGATCLWLLPFYPTPNRDNGYDVTDFYTVDPRLGTLGDFVTFMHAAEERGLKVIIDLVANHTSIDHPWFKEARSSRESRYRNWYVWSDVEPENKEEGVVFPGVQDAIWSYDEVAGAWYHHRFYDHQADLNTANPEVREEIRKIMAFWLRLGVYGFRIDAVPFLIEYIGLPDEQRPDRDPHLYLTEMHRFVAWRRPQAVLLAEANITADQVDDFFGSGDRMHMIFHFTLNQHVFLALARGDAEPIARAMKATPAIPSEGQWVTFLRNHDEIDLGRLSDAERQEAYAAFGPEPDMQLYNRGVRRRLAPMLGGDPRKLRLAFSLLFSLPGTPMIWYGDEIGMGDDLSLPERISVRTPMQWSGGRNGGFSNAAPERLVRPVVSDPQFGFARINVAGQRDDPESLMEHVQHVIRMRRSCPEIGCGRCDIVETGAPGALALRYTWRGETVIVVNNLRGAPAEVRLRMPAVQLETVLSDDGLHDHISSAGAIAVAPYGFRWLRLAQRT